MGKLMGFLEIERKESIEQDPLKRIKHFNEFHTPLSQAKQSAQAARCMDCGVPFCQNGKVIQGMVSGCPLNNLVPETNDLVYHGNYKAALTRLLKTNNFPEFTSRVCPALCEKACTCSLNGDSVTVRENERGIIEEGYLQGWITAKPPKYRIDQKIAVVGSGPSGLAAADCLNKRGYHVTVFERADRIGGLLMYGIPNMKLEKHVIDRKVEIMKQEGIEFKVNSGIENKQQADALLQDYDKVILACGSRVPRDIKVPGRESPSIHFAVDYLTSVTKSLLDSDLKDHHYFPTKGKRVLVIGGGDTGNDCVGTAVRLGCKSVIQLEMMPELPETRLASNPWPEWPRVKKTDYGQIEAAAVFGNDPRVYSTTVKEFILDEQNNVKQAVIVKLDSSLKMIEGSEETIDVDLVLIAAGFIGAESNVVKAFDVDTTKRNTVLDDHYRTTKENVYVCGDMRRGQSLVVWAIREGREVARVVDYDFNGYTNI